MIDDKWFCKIYDAKNQCTRRLKVTGPLTLEALRDAYLQSGGVRKIWLGGRLYWREETWIGFAKRYLRRWLSKR